MKKIAFIWAENNLGFIGKDGKIPWKLPDDLQFFKDQTKGHPVVMGRRTFDSLNVKPLPGRENIVLTHDLSWKYDDVVVMYNVEEMLHYTETIQYAEDDTIFVIGGAQIYQELLNNVDLLYITKVDNDVIGDTKMPVINLADFELIKDFAGHVNDANIYPHHFYIYRRKSLSVCQYK